jgi:hypothetical protein
MKLLQQRPLTQQKALACVATNTGLPGFGTLAAGRLSGWFQASLTVISLLLTLVFGTRFVIWSWSNMSRLQNAVDPLAALEELWVACRWALLGLALFAIAWVWSLISSLSILRSLKNTAEANPPRVTE